MHKVYKNDLEVKKLILRWIKENKIRTTLDSNLDYYCIAIGIVKYQNLFLMTKRRKKEANLEWGFPAVQIKPNSDQGALLKNEIKKETNINVKILLKIGERVPPNIPVFASYYICEYIDGEITNLDSEENEVVEWVSAENALQRITSDIFPPLKEILLNSK